MNPDTQKFLTEEREAYIKSSDELMKTYNAYDKTVLTLSSGAIGICLLLFKEAPICVDKRLLIASTIAFGFSLISILFSYFFGIAGFKRAMLNSGNRIDRVRSALEGKAISELKELSIKQLQISTDICNFTSGLAFIIGIVLIAIFVFNTYT